MARVVIDPAGMARLHEELERLTEYMTEGVEADARQNWREHVETGKTLATVHAEHHGLYGHVWVAGKVWQFVEYGTQPHTIVVKTGNPFDYALRNREKNFYRYPGIVRHPGNEEFAPMRRAAFRKRDRFGIATSPPLGGL